MRILDLFCGAGGASMGYWRAGFEVVGVDIEPQPNYPFGFHQLNVLDLPPHWIEQGAFSAIHASPPCQAFTQAQKLQNNSHPNLILPVRNLLHKSGLPYVIENVPGSPLINPVTLEGSMFGLRTYRPRLFETNFPLIAPPKPPRARKTTKMGRPPVDGEFMHVVGNFSGADEGRWAMGIDWMTKKELAEAIPPAYTGYVGCFLHQHLQAAA
jgi:DNA (cytosine-5)-methyltransferase 1